MRFHILGVGSIGSLLAYHLRAVLPRTHSVTLIHKSMLQAHKKASSGKISVENRGVVQTCDGFDYAVFDERDTLRRENYNPTLSTETIPIENLRTSRTDHIETLFVTTKAHIAAGAVYRLLPRLTAQSTIVLLQNGMGIYEDLVQKHFLNPETRPHFILTSNTHGAWSKSPVHIVHAGLGNIEFGLVPDPRGKDFEASLSDESKPLHERELDLEDITRRDDASYSQYSSLRNTVSALVSLRALECKWKPIADVQLAMRKKLVVNSVVNPLTAILGCRNGALFEDEASRQILWDVCNEAAAAFRAQLQGDTNAYLHSLPPGEEGSQVPLGRIPPDLRAEALVEEVKRVAHLTRGNISSTLADIKKGRRTEISFLNGYLVRLGQEYGVPMPVNSSLVNLVNMRSAIPVDQMW